MSLKVELTALEARVIGCLIEKAITTPDQYPLSLNALVNACNQKSNRDPVMDLSEATVQQTVDGLSKKHLVMEKSGFGSRVPKYQHRFCNTEFGTLKLDPQELAIVCELLVRGPQTPGELRTRAARMAPFGEATEAESTLARLRDRPDGPFVVQLAREPGRRDSRWAHLFSGPVADVAPAPAYPQSALVREPEPAGPAEVVFPATHNDERLTKLETEVAALRAELDELKRRLGD
jgi:uncharacterized protein YceH (UPF0502 family)